MIVLISRIRYRSTRSIRSPVCTRRRSAFVTFHFRGFPDEENLRWSAAERPGPWECSSVVRKTGSNGVLCRTNGGPVLLPSMKRTVCVTRMHRAGEGSRDTHQPRAEGQSLAGWPIASWTRRRRPPIMLCSQSEYTTVSLSFSFSLLPFPLVYD